MTKIRFEEHEKTKPIKANFPLSRGPKELNRPQKSETGCQISDIRHLFSVICSSGSYRLAGFCLPACQRAV
jgi:hypothetical protein